jgi:threonine/homoserine/homoserine lactone efflux protein
MMRSTMLESLPFLLSGIVFGSTGGLTPGPTLTLVIAQTLRYDLREGLKIAISPLLTDAPIVLAAVFLLSRIDAEPVLGVVSLLGSGFLVYLAQDSFRVKPPDLVDGSPNPRSLRKGFLANLLNPHPYLFWLMIGGPMMLKAASVSASSAVLFIVGHYTCLIGAKMLVAVLVQRGRSLLARGYVRVMRVLALALLVFALIFLRDGLRFLGLL